MQIDFGERRVVIGGQQMTVYFFVATLGFSRRIYVRASLSQRQDEWKLGLDGAMERFGGRPEVVVVDNARALILEHTSEHKVVHPAFAAFCKDRGLAVFACRPYRARTKGKVESGVKYVKRNAIARRRFESFRAMEEHLERWMAKADQRQHGTTHRRPIDLFVEKEAAALRPLRAALPAATQRLRRMVANDCYVDIDTVRYSVPHRLARATVEVTQSDEAVRIWKGSELVAEHRRSHEPYARVTDPSHFVGLHTPSAAISELAAAGAEAVNPLAAFGRSLSDYHQIIGGAP
jgi:transposase